MRYGRNEDRQHFCLFSHVGEVFVEAKRKINALQWVWDTLFLRREQMTKDTEAIGYPLHGANEPSVGLRSTGVSPYHTVFLAGGGAHVVCVNEMGSHCCLWQTVSRGAAAFPFQQPHLERADKIGGVSPPSRKKTKAAMGEAQANAGTISHCLGPPG